MNVVWTECETMEKTHIVSAKQKPHEWSGKNLYVSTVVSGCVVNIRERVSGNRQKIVRAASGYKLCGGSFPIPIPHSSLNRLCDVMKWRLMASARESRSAARKGQNCARIRSNNREGKFSAFLTLIGKSMESNVYASLSESVVVSCNNSENM